MNRLYTYLYEGDQGGQVLSATIGAKGPDEADAVFKQYHDTPFIFAIFVTYDIPEFVYMSD